MDFDWIQASTGKTHFHTENFTCWIVKHIGQSAIKIEQEIRTSMVASEYGYYADCVFSVVS